MPWKTFAEMFRQVTVLRMQMGPCENGPLEVAVALVEYQGDEWGYWYAAETDRLVVAYYPKGQDVPTEVGIGQVDPKQNDVIPPITWRPYTSTMAGPCDLLRATT